jgi:hypothetical protein
MTAGCYTTERKAMRGDEGSIAGRIKRLGIEGRERELEMLEKQCEKWCSEAEQSSGQAKADLEEIVKQYGARITDLRGDLTERRPRREALQRGRATEKLSDKLSA